MAKDESTNFDYSFNVLREQVATDDLFEDKTHERVAESLKSFISHTETGVTIGLEGGWGSGKSTVINLLKKKLMQDNGNTLFFVFDAWAHDGDPLRKIFLESLISSIDPRQQDNALNELRDEVSARKKSVFVKSKKSASLLGKLLSLSALPIPVGAALLTAVKYDKLFFPFSSGATEPNFTFIFGILLSFFPVITLLIWACCGRKDKNTGKVEWDVFESESDESYTQDITEDGERTSIEFEKFFNRILNYLFSDDSEYDYQRIMIVIDNLDRVEPDYAKNIWSTLQTFFQYRSSSVNDVTSGQWEDKIWILIPYDKEGIRDSWPTNVGKNEKDSQHVASSFMEKCFQVIAEVPTPVMSAWIGYLERCIESAFIGWPETKKKEFIESYIRCMSKLDKSPSPRQIQHHLNRAGMLAFHWKEKISSEAICIYTLCRQKSTEAELRASLLSEGIPNSYPCQRSAYELKPELAGMLFGVNPEKGMQLLLAPEIKASIKNGDGEKLSELASTHKRAFWLAFRATSDQWMVSESHTDNYKINTVNALYKAFNSSKSYLSPYMAKIESAFIDSFDNWKLSEYSYKECIVYLTELSANSFLYKKFSDKLKSRISRTVNLTGGPNFPKDDLKNLFELESLFAKKNQQLKITFYPKLDLNFWKEWLMYCKESSVDFNSVLPRKETFTDLVTNTGFGNASLNNENFEALLVTYKKYSDRQYWTSLPTALIKWFKLTTRAHLAEEQYELAIRLFSSASDDDVNALKLCTKSPAFWRIGANSAIDKNPSLPYLIALSDENFRNNQSVSAAVKDFLSTELNQEQILNAYESFKLSNDFLAIWKLAIDEKNLFARQILKTIDDSKLYSQGAFYVDEVHWRNQDEVASAVAKLCKYDAFSDIEESIKEDPNAFHKIIYMMKQYGDYKAQEFIEILLKDLSRDRWYKSLKENDQLLKCVPENSSLFSKAWGDYFELIVSGEIEVVDDSEFNFKYDLKDKVLDLYSIYVPRITIKYFENTSTDPLNDEIFNIISPLLLSAMDKVNQKNYEIRLSNWIDNNKISKLKWFLGADVNTKDTPLETIIVDIKRKLETLNPNSDEYILYGKLSNKLSLEIEKELQNSSDEISAEIGS